MEKLNKSSLKDIMRALERVEELDKFLGHVSDKLSQQFYNDADGEAIRILALPINAPNDYTNIEFDSMCNAALVGLFNSLLIQRNEIVAEYQDMIDFPESGHKLQDQNIPFF